MSLLIPDSGLLFWMLLAFLIVLFILWKFGWSVIVNMVNERNEYINQSVKKAHEINERMDTLETESNNIIEATRKKQLEMMQESEKMKQSIINDAKEKAQKEADKILKIAHQEILKEKEEAMKEIRSQVSKTSIDIAEKILRKKLENTPEQKELLDKLLDEVAI